MSNRSRAHSLISRGFTIVELVVVVVVIGILATITIVSYNGIQDKANNTAIIDSASSIVKMIQLYATTNGAYPSTTSGGFCITTASACSWIDTPYAGDSTFDTNIATVGNAPKSVPTVITSGLKGIFYYYTSGLTMNGKPQPVYIAYFLKGAAQQCGVPRVYNYPNPTTVSTTGYSESTGFAGMAITRCYISVPGPTS